MYARWEHDYAASNKTVCILDVLVRTNITVMVDWAYNTNLLGVLVGVIVSRHDPNLSRPVI